MIATQEPTLSPQLIDLCNICIVHRFNSPAWFNILKDHLAGAKAGFDGSKGDAQLLFDKIVALRTGEAFLFCPTALLDVIESQMVNLQNGFLRVKMRPRCSADGGRSILASDRLFLTSIEPHRVSDIVRPYPRREKTKTRLGKGSREGRSVSGPMLDNPIPAVVHSTTPVIALPSVAVSTAAQPPAMPPASQLYQTKFEKKIILDDLRKKTLASLRENPNSLAYHEVRRSVTASLHLPNGFFNDSDWAKRSKSIIDEQAVCGM